jgi:hypothetical protein
LLKLPLPGLVIKKVLQNVPEMPNIRVVLSKLPLCLMQPRIGHRARPVLHHAQDIAHRNEDEVAVCALPVRDRDPSIRPVPERCPPLPEKLSLVLLKTL